jgi:hypothetical protein
MVSLYLGSEEEITKRCVVLQLAHVLHVVVVKRKMALPLLLEIKPVTTPVASPVGPLAAIADEVTNINTIANFRVTNPLASQNSIAFMIASNYSTTTLRHADDSS